ncbi:MAG: hypothetical protein R3F29_01400 [Planctomycetota bacterium]
MMQRPRTSLAWTLALGGTLLLLAVALRLAWLGDDCYITLRTVENAAQGHGLRWNVDERVQTYTHPLWMLGLLAGRLVTGEVYFTTITICLVLSTAAVAWLLLRAASPAAIVGTFALLLGARAFGDYMTSGLETPATFVLLVAFVAAAQSGAPARWRYLAIVLLASLAVTNRMDLAVLCLPTAVAAMRGVSWRDRVVWGAVGAAPFALWIAFATFYYGSPFPVTAYAKAFGVGIPAGDIAVQGLRYVWHAVVTDPVLAVTAIGGGVAATIVRSTRWLGLGALLYVGYVIKVGGDFMQGRFLLPPFVVVVACIGGWMRGIRERLTTKLAMLAAQSMFALSLFAGLLQWARPPAADLPLSQAQIEAQHGIVDERRMYYRELGLFSPSRAIPEYGALERVAFPEGREQPWFLLNGAVGAAGYGVGARGHVVDPLLCDPVVARLPARDPNHWRIGHVLRRIPEGYYETLASGDNRIVHDGLRRWYEDLRVATRAPLLSSARFAAAWRLITGANRDGFTAFVAEHYRTPPRVEVAAERLDALAMPGAYWFDEPNVQLVYDGGIAVRLPAARAATTMRLQLLSGMFFRYRVRFVRDGAVLGEAFAAVLPPPALAPLRVAAGLLEHQVAVPADVGAFDTLWLDFVETAESDKATGPAGVSGLRFD